MFLVDLRNYLTEKGITYPIFVGNRPNTPVNCLTLYEFEGAAIEEHSNVVIPSMQIMLRTDNFEEGYEQLEKATDYLLEIGAEGELAEGIKINDTMYFKVNLVQAGFMQLGKDENGHQLMSANFNVAKTRR